MWKNWSYTHDYSLHCTTPGPIIKFIKSIFRSLVILAMWLALGSVIYNGNWMEWSAIWSEIINCVISKLIWNLKYDFSPRSHNPKFNCHFIASIVKSHNLTAYLVNTRTTRFWSVPLFIEPVARFRINHTGQSQSHCKDNQWLISSQITLFFYSKSHSKWGVNMFLVPWTRAVRFWNHMILDQIAV